MKNDFDIHNWQAKFLKEESSNTKTAVEWLEERLAISFGEEIKSLRGFFVIAKEQEKQQIEDAYEKGISDRESRRYSEEYNSNNYTK
jgi:hypothetical protein